MSPSIYFYCCDDPGNLQEDVITLAEGFRELGVAFYSNCNYWPESNEPGDFLIKHNPNVTPDDCDVVVVSYTWPYWIRMGTFDLVRRPLPEDLFHPRRRYKTVYMDHHDGHRTISWEPEYRQFDLILRAKLNNRAWYPDNMRPWVLGLSKRILDAVAGAPAFEQRNATILVNFGASHPYPHGSRVTAEASFIPRVAKILKVDRTIDDLSVEPAGEYDALMWRLTGHRFSRTYYERLKRAQAVACFCGELIPPLPYRAPEQYLVGGNRAKVTRAWFDALGRIDPRPKRSVQWDSFRFWEALAAGCVAFNLDLERYGVSVPVMPKNGAHYIGVDLDNPKRMDEQLSCDTSQLARIAAAGRDWALEHYAPRATAQRFLRELGYGA